MKRRIAALALAGLVLSVFATGASAQTLTPIGPADAVDLARAQPVIYKLADEASYTEGCWAPCLCPIWMADSIKGTLILTQTGPGGTYFTYKVSQVNWWVNRGGTEIRVTGEGEYVRISGVAGWMHQMKLSLSIDGADAVTFDSGMVDGGGDFPRLTGLTLSKNGLYCYDIAIDVEAAPVPRKDIACYKLSGRHSTYEEGCQPPCLCPILYQGPLTGGFTLVTLEDYGTVIEYAVVNVDWRVRPIYGPPPSSRFVGYGRYTRISGFAGWWHQMELDLSIDGGPLTLFDSGGINGGGEFPLIDIALAKNNFFCYDIILDILAKPCPSLSTASIDD